TVFTFFSTFRVMVLCLSFLGPLFTPVAYHDPLLFAELLGHYLFLWDLEIIPLSSLLVSAFPDTGSHYPAGTLDSH
ncbi:MAG: hypothetical protein KA117_10750, partial [Verrucomicrobia bacterium]|nr:hypothetical protein [Verrucomicrobiota bacterium]